MKTKVIRITLKSLRLIKSIIPPKYDEPLVHYFDRVASELEYRDNERWQGNDD